VTTLAVTHSPTSVLTRKYDRSALRADEVEALGDVAARKGGGAWAPNAPRALARLVLPIHDAINSLHLVTDWAGRRANEHSYARFRLRCTWPILRHVHVLGRTYWEWSELEWRTLIEHGRKEGRVPASAVAYVLRGIRPSLPARLQFSYSHLYKVIFGQAAWDQIEPKISRTLASWGFAVGRSNNGYVQALAILLLDGHASRLEDLSRELLEAHVSERGPALRYVRPIATALHHFGIIDRQLPMPPGPKQAPPWDGVAAEWHALVREWQARAVYSRGHVGHVVNAAWNAGQWLAEYHPEVTRPEQWTPELAAHFLRCVMDWTTEQYLPADRVSPNMAGVANPSRRGKPLATHTRIGLISGLRNLFRDLRRWKLIGPLEIDPRQDLATPKALLRLRSPNPRDIRQAVWMKLVWASLNLADEDCPQPAGTQARFQPGYSPTLLRAAAVLWTHAGLRSDELSRLEIGCVRELSPGMDPELQEELDRDVAAFWKSASRTNRPSTVTPSTMCSTPDSMPRQ